jgi:hypothetical protein
MTFDELLPLLQASRATDAFTADVAQYAARDGEAARIEVTGRCPRVKVLRTIAQLAHAEPALAVDHIRVHGESGCADFVGTVSAVDVEGETHTFAFEWNCETKARDVGYTDFFGLPDQIRAAREFGWKCFQQWERTTPAQQRVA